MQAEEGTAAVQAKVVEILADIRDRLRILGADSMKGQAEVILKGHLSALRFVEMNVFCGAKTCMKGCIFRPPHFEYIRCITV